jgi:hypothetical protein
MKPEPGLKLMSLVHLQHKILQWAAEWCLVSLLFRFDIFPFFVWVELESAKDPRLRRSNAAAHLSFSAVSEARFTFCSADAAVDENKSGKALLQFFCCFFPAQKVNYSNGTLWARLERISRREISAFFVQLSISLFAFENKETLVKLSRIHWEMTLWKRNSYTYFKKSLKLLTTFFTKNVEWTIPTSTAASTTTAVKKMAPLTSMLK